MTEPKDKMHFYESFADEFDSKMNMYDTNKRLDVFFNEMLKNEQIQGKQVLDAGCGTGWFSMAASKAGAVVTSMDLGEKLLSQVQKKCDTKRVVGSVLDMPFKNDTFDFIISSEVIEHTPSPNTAICEMYRVLKPGGTLILSTPNKFWYWSLKVAEKFKLRPYQGLENWSGYRELRNATMNAGFEILEQKGIHLLPFIHPLIYPINNFFHAFSSSLGPVMVNIVIKARKQGSHK